MHKSDTNAEFILLCLLELNGCQGQGGSGAGVGGKRGAKGKVPGREISSSTDQWLVSVRTAGTSSVFSCFVSM